MPVLEAPSWTADVERGPNWIFLRVHAPNKTAGDGNELADVVWQTISNTWPIASCWRWTI